AGWLAQALDPAAGMVRLVAMGREAYRAASFLDDRLLQQPIDAQIVPWPDVEDAMAGALRHDARWIFHIGHVGSTLVSRLLGELAGVLAIREPRLLRDLALTPAEVRSRYIAAAPKLMSRTFAAEEIACVKATSFASEIAPEWADFDAMLDDMAAQLGRISAFFGFAAEPDQLAAIAGGPLMARYSKALEHEYSPQLRRDLLAQATAAHGAEIDRALAMLRSAA